MNITKSSSALVKKSYKSSTQIENMPDNIQQLKNSQQISRTDNVNEKRTCWICLETDVDNWSVAWVHPCKCRGSTKWLHEICLCRWINESQRDNTSIAVSCHLCKTEYIMVCPHMGIVANGLEALDNLLNYFCLVLMEFILLFAFYLTILTYGAVSFVQFVGIETLAYLENGNTVVRLIGLPAIPVALLLGHFIHWKNVVIHLIRNCRRIAPTFFMMRFNILDFGNNNDNLSIISEPDSSESIFCFALLLPTISSSVGHFLFQSIKNIFYRTLLGGFTFLIMKSILNICLESCAKRKDFYVANYTEANIRT